MDEGTVRPEPEAPGRVLHAVRQHQHRLATVPAWRRNETGTVNGGAKLGLRGLDPGTALGQGVAAAALSCRTFGCALSYPARAEIDALAESLV